MTELLVRIAPWSTILAAIAVATTPDAADDTITFIIRGTIAIGLIAVSYLLKQVADTARKTNEMVVDHDAILRLHGLMFEQWLAKLGEGEVDNPGRRETDRLLQSILEMRKKR